MWACRTSGRGHGGQLLSTRIAGKVSRATRPTFVDVNSPALAINCPNCGLLTARFGQYCRNCGYSIWPSSRFASAAFQAWREVDPARRDCSRFDLEPPLRPEDQVVVVDFEQKAHELGIHMPPGSSYPIIICLGLFFMALAAVPFATPARLVLAVIGLAIFLFGVIGWVVVEDTRHYPGFEAASRGAHTEAMAAAPAAAQPTETRVEEVH